MANADQALGLSLGSATTAYSNERSAIDQQFGSALSSANEAHARTTGEDGQELPKGSDAWMGWQESSRKPDPQGERQLSGAFGNQSWGIHNASPQMGQRKLPNQQKPDPIPITRSTVLFAQANPVLFKEFSIRYGVQGVKKLDQALDSGWKVGIDDTFAWHNAYNDATIQTMWIEKDLSIGDQAKQLNRLVGILHANDAINPAAVDGMLRPGSIEIWDGSVSQSNSLIKAKAQAKKLIKDTARDATIEAATGGLGIYATGAGHIYDATKLADGAADTIKSVKVASAASVKGLNIVNGNHFHMIDDLLKAGAAADRNGLTKAGRALQKHGDRAGSVFPKLTGDLASRNAQGQSILEGILRSTSQSTRSNRYGGFDVFDLITKRGARFDGNGNFVGFLEP